MNFRRFLLWVILAWFLMHEFSLACSAPLNQIQIIGQVTRRDTGESLENAKILIWSMDPYLTPKLEVEGYSGTDGSFEFILATNRPKCLIYVYYDNPSTSGFDTAPMVIEIDTSEHSHSVSFALEKASTVVLDGPLRLADSSSNIVDYKCDVLDPDTGKIIKIGSFEMRYSTRNYDHNKFLQLDPTMIIVPADIPFNIEITPVYMVETRRMRGWSLRRYQKSYIVGHREIPIGDEQGYILSEGELLQINIREFTLISDIAFVEDQLDSLEVSLLEREEQGFYIVSERNEITKIIGLKEDAASNLDLVLLEEAYIDIRQAYLFSMMLKSKLLGMEREAYISLNILVPFIAFASIAVSYLLIEQSPALKKFFLSTVIFVLLSLYLYTIHPGRTVVSLLDYASVSVITYVITTGFVSLLPKIAGEIKLDEQLSFLASLESLFSMAKRNLRRRRLRFVFTLTSIFCLSLSFVTLTSLSTGYGLISSPQRWAKVDKKGLVVKRLPFVTGNPLMKGLFHEVTDEISDWIKEREEVQAVARKAENYPSLRPYGYIGEQPIYGIVGIEASIEPLLVDIQESIVEGEFPSSSSAVLISDTALKMQGASIGDVITLQETQLKITGTFDIDIMEIKDINGELFAPKMQINLTPGSGPTIVVQPCKHEEMIITTHEKALEIHKDIHVSRVAAILNEGVDAVSLAESLALERGVMVWASDGKELYSSHVGEYFLGKGLPLLVPWVLVILNVAMTMLNSMFERRGEMAILSSVGLNPSHIAGLYLAEASIISVIGGGFGYLMGIGLYPLMSRIGFAPVVSQKISVNWSLGAMGISLVATAVGVIVALRSTTVITPSSERRWEISRSPQSHLKPWIIPIPSRIRPNKVEEFIDFMKRGLREYSDTSSYPNILGIRESSEMENNNKVRIISFWYREGDTGLGGSSTSCRLRVFKKEGEEYCSAQLHSYGAERDIRRAGNFIRSIVIRWHTENQA